MLLDSARLSGALEQSERRRLTAAIAGMSIITVVAAIASPSIMGTMPWFDPMVWAALVALPLYAALWWAAQTHPVKRIAPLFVFAAMAATWTYTATLPASGYPAGSYAHVTIAVMLAAFLLNARWTATVAGLNLAGLVAMNAIQPFPAGVLRESLSLQILIAAILVAMASLLGKQNSWLQGADDGLLATMKRHETVTQASQDAIMTLDSEGRLTSLNPRATKLFPQVIGKALKEGDYLAAEITPEMGRAFEQLQRGVATSGLAELEAEFETTSGRRAFHAKLVPDGQQGVILFATDVTDQHVRWEQERERQLQEERYKNLQQSENMHRNFINMASHELQTPLTPLRLQSRMLKVRGKSYLNKKDIDALEMIERNTERMAHLIEDILEVVRIGNGKLPVEFSNVDLVHVCRTAVLDRIPAAEEQGIDLEFDGPERAMAYADHVRIEQVLGNLISNAIKFSPDGSNIDVLLHDDPQEIHIDVIDDGEGMTQDEIDGLYKPFAQFHQDSAPRAGTGLGLAICQGIMEAHGGSIAAHSAGRGRGTTFTITIPRKGPPVNEEAGPEEHEKLLTK